MKKVILSVMVVVLFISVFSVSFARQNALYNSPEKRIKNKVELDQTVKVLNYTNYTDLDTIINITAQILKIKNVKIVCVPLNEEEQEIYFAYIQEKEGYYLIRVNSKLSEDLLIETCAHESVHLMDYELGILEAFTYGFRYYDKVYPFIVLKGMYSRIENNIRVWYKQGDIINLERPNRFYFCVPESLLDKVKDLLPDYAGLFYVTEYGGIRKYKEAKLLHKEKRLKEIESVLCRKFYYSYLELKQKSLNAEKSPTI